MISKTIIPIALSMLMLFVMPLGLTHVTADCNLPGNGHGDNSPSEKKGEKMLEKGASACDIAKKCDAMSISIDIDNKKELHQTAMYQNASDKVQEKLDHAVKEGNGADGIYCYEVEDIFND